MEKWCLFLKLSVSSKITYTIFPIDLSVIASLKMFNNCFSHVPFTFKTKEQIYPKIVPRAYFLFYFPKAFDEKKKKMKDVVCSFSLQKKKMLIKFWFIRK